MTTDAATDDKTCKYCGGIFGHPGVCPRVKAIEYAPDGSVRRVEFHAPATVWDFGAWKPCTGAARISADLSGWPHVQVWIDGPSWSIGEERHPDGNGQDHISRTGGGGVDQRQ